MSHKNLLISMLHRRNIELENINTQLMADLREAEETKRQLEEKPVGSVSIETLQIVLNQAWGSGGHQHTRYSHALQERLDNIGVFVRIGPH